MYPVLPQTEADFSNWLKGFHLIQITHFIFAVIALWLGSIPENCSFFYEAGKISVFRLTPSTTLLKTFLFFVCIGFCQFSFKGILILYTRKVVKNKNKEIQRYQSWDLNEKYPPYIHVFEQFVLSSGADWCGYRGSSALLEEVCLRGWALRFYSLHPLPVLSFSASCVWMKCDHSASWLPGWPSGSCFHVSPPVMDCIAFETVSQNKCFSSLNCFLSGYSITATEK